MLPYAFAVGWAQKGDLVQTRGGFWRKRAFWAARLQLEGRRMAIPCKRVAASMDDGQDGCSLIVVLTGPCSGFRGSISR